MNTRLLLPASLCLVAALITWIAIVSTRSTPVDAIPSHESSTQTPSEADPATRLRELHRTTVHAGDLSRQRLTLLIRKAESGDPLAGATVHPLSKSDDSFLPPMEHALGTSTQDGAVEASVDEITQPYLLIVSPGRIPAVVEFASARQQDSPVEVSLNVASSLRVDVLDESGRPVEGALVLLSSTSYGAPADVPRKANANPLAPRLMWSRTTDGTGSADLANLPSGRLWVSAMHPHYVPYSTAELNRLVDLPSVKHLALTMKALYGVVFECPSDAAVRSVHWDNSLMQLEISGNVVTRIGRGRRKLLERFPNGIVYVHRPRNTNLDVMTRCWAVAEDDTVWFGEWPLRPVKEIAVPVFLSQDLDHTYRELRVEIRAGQGRVLPADVLLYNEEMGLHITCRFGERQLLPLGAYRVGVMRASRQLREALGAVELTLSLSKPVGDELIIELEDDLIPLSIRPVLPDEDALSFIHFRIRTSDGKTMMMANWAPSQGDIETAVPPGPVTVEARSAAYEDARAEVLADGERAVLEIPFLGRPSGGR